MVSATRFNFNSKSNWKFSDLSGLGPMLKTLWVSTPPKQAQQLLLSGTHELAYRERIQLQDLASSEFNLSPRLEHSTEQFMPSTAAKNTLGDVAPQQGFLRTQQWYWQLPHVLWLGKYVAGAPTLPYTGMVTVGCCIPQNF